MTTVCLYLAMSEGGLHRQRASGGELQFSRRGERGDPSASPVACPARKDSSLRIEVLAAIESEVFASSSCPP